MAPFVPTPPRVLKWLRKTVEDLFVDKRSQPIVYDAGCGNGIVIEVLSTSVLAYGVCTELNTMRAYEAWRFIKTRNSGHLVDVVIGDILSFRLRKLDLAYAFLMPLPMDSLAELLPENALLVSLDFPTTKLQLEAVVPIGSHTVYIYSRKR